MSCCLGNAGRPLREQNSGTFQSAHKNGPDRQSRETVVVWHECLCANQSMADANLGSFPVQSYFCIARRCRSYWSLCHFQSWSMEPGSTPFHICVTHLTLRPAALTTQLHFRYTNGLLHVILLAVNRWYTAWMITTGIHRVQVYLAWVCWLAED